MDKLFFQRNPLWRRLRCAAPDLLGTVSRHGFYPTDLARDPERYRSDVGSQLEQAVRNGISPQGSQFYTGRCQRVSRLANLVRLSCSSYPARLQALSGRGLGARSQNHGLPIGTHHYRSVTESVRLGDVQQS